VRKEELLELNQKLYDVQKKSDSLSKELWKTSQAISDNNRDSFDAYCDSELFLTIMPMDIRHFNFLWHTRFKKDYPDIYEDISKVGKGLMQKDGKLRNKLNSSISEIDFIKRQIDIFLKYPDCSIEPIGNIGETSKYVF